MGFYGARRNSEVRISEQQHPIEMSMEQRAKESLSPEIRAELEKQAKQSAEIPVLRADREPTREELRTIRELLDANTALWNELGVKEVVATEDQFVPVQEKTLSAHVGTLSEIQHDALSLVQNNHVYFSNHSNEMERLRILSHELSHLSAKRTLQVDVKPSTTSGTPFDATVRVRKEGPRGASPAWEAKDGFVGNRSFEGYYEGLTEMMASEVRHFWCESKGIPPDSQQYGVITSVNAEFGPATRIIQEVMTQYVVAHPGVSLQQLKDEAYLDVHNGTTHFLKRLHAWSRAVIAPLARMGVSYQSMSDAARWLVSEQLADDIEQRGKVMGRWGDV